MNSIDSSKFNSKSYRNESEDMTIKERIDLLKDKAKARKLQDKKRVNYHKEENKVRSSYEDNADRPRMFSIRNVKYPENRTEISFKECSDIIMTQMPDLPDKSKNYMLGEIDFVISKMDENCDNLVQPDEFKEVCR